MNDNALAKVLVKKVIENLLNFPNLVLTSQIAFDESLIRFIHRGLQGITDFHAYASNVDNILKTMLLTLLNLVELGQFDFKNCYLNSNFQTILIQFKDVFCSNDYSTNYSFVIALVYNKEREWYTIKFYLKELDDELEVTDVTNYKLTRKFFNNFFSYFEDKTSSKFKKIKF